LTKQWDSGIVRTTFEEGIHLRVRFYLGGLIIMKLVIDSSCATGSLHLKVAGFSIEVSDVCESGKIAIIQDSGKVSVEVLSIEKEVQEVKVVETVEAVQDIEVVQKIQAVHKVEPQIQSKPLSEAVTKEVSSDLLFQRLVSLRREIAKEVMLPPYIIFHDTSLKDMASKLPLDLEAMKSISGVGQAKLDKYGSRFIEAIKEYVSKVA
jgi:superfamily II DNA helicase RecQ